MFNIRGLGGASLPKIFYSAFVIVSTTRSIPFLLIIRFVIYFVSYRMSEEAISLLLAVVIQASILVYRGTPHHMSVFLDLKMFKADGVSRARALDSL